MPDNDGFVALVVSAVTTVVASWVWAMYGRTAALVLAIAVIVVTAGLVLFKRGRRRSLRERCRRIIVSGRRDSVVYASVARHGQITERLRNYEAAMERAGLAEGGHYALADSVEPVLAGIHSTMWHAATNQEAAPKRVVLEALTAVTASVFTAIDTARSAQASFTIAIPPEPHHSPPLALVKKHDSASSLTELAAQVDEDRTIHQHALDEIARINDPEGPAK